MKRKKEKPDFVLTLTCSDPSTGQYVEQEVTADTPITLNIDAGYTCKTDTHEFKLKRPITVWVGLR